MMASLKMLRTVAGPDGTWSGRVTYLVPDEMPMSQAVEFVKRKHAEWIEKPDRVERATAKHRRKENTDARPKEE